MIFLKEYILDILSEKELKTIIDETGRNVIQYYLEKSIEMQPELIQGQKELPIQVPKEHIEQWLVQAIGGQSVGAGNYPIDLISGDKGFDAKMV